MNRKQKPAAACIAAVLVALSGGLAGQKSSLQAQVQAYGANTY